MRVRPSARRLGAAAAVVVALTLVLTGCDDPPTSVLTTVGYDCQIDAHNFLLPPFSDDTLDGDYTVTAPQAVAPGGELVATVVPEQFAVDGTPTGSGTIAQISNLVWKVAIPANTTLVSHSIEGWANVGVGTPTSTVTSGAVVVTVPGPILAGVLATLPTVTLNLQATGALGSTIKPKIAGTSYASPGLAFDARVTGTLLGTINASLACFPSPSPSLHTTLISNDTKAPTITITAPVADQVITQGAVVLADFACDDGAGVGVASCVGTVADGAAINTSSLGTHDFTVTATDNEGKVGHQTVSYTVNPA